jgi:putative ABC transport system permease protein
MNVVSRGVRNAFRNQIRTASVVVILGMSIGLALAMLIARQAVETKIETVKSSIGNTISISPAGAQGFQGGGEPLTTAQLAKVSSLPNITKVTESLSDRLTTDDTNLVSSIEAGSLGRRQARNSGVGFQGAPADGAAPTMPDSAGGTSGTTGITRTFTPPVTVTGTTDMTSASTYGGTIVKFTSGQALDPSKDEDKAVVGTALATKNNLKVGSTFTAYTKTITVAGIYDAGSTFANGGVIMSLPALQRLSSQAGDVTSATATINSIDNIDTATTAIKSALGSTADVVNSQETAKQAIAPLESVKTISLYSLIGALIAGALIILLTMVMIVRERRREIGVMKAIGASNASTMFQFMAEAVTLTALGLIVGLIIGVAAANPITKVLVNNSSSSTTAQVTQPGQASGRAGFAGGGAGRQGGFGGQRSLRNLGTSSLTNIRDVKASIGLSVLGYGIAAALAIAIIGSAIPAYFISKIRPAEVMRAD